MSKCGWCGEIITGAHILKTKIKAVVMIDSNTEVELMPDHTVGFCCNGCAWAFFAETHRLMGLSGNDLRTHLIGVHGISHPPGKPAGGMRHDCLVVDMANSLVSVFSNKT